MFGAATLVVVLLAATAAVADDGPRGPERWIVDDDDLRKEQAAPVRAPGADPLSRLIEHCKHKAVGVRPLLTLMPSEARDGTLSRFPTLALFARVHNRTIVSLTHVQASRTDVGQEVVMQRTAVSDLFAGRRFSLTVYEDHALGETAKRLMGVGTRLTFRPTLDVAGWRLRFEVLGSYDLDAGASGYLALTGALQPPPLPTGIGR